MQKVEEVFNLPGRYAALIGSYRRFGTAYRPPYSRVKLSRKLEPGEDGLSRNDGNYRPTLLTTQKSEDFIHTAAEA